MSYDIYLRGSKCEHCGHQPEGPCLPHPTYNLTPIFDLAFTGEPLPNPEVSEGSVVILHEKTDRPRGLRLLSGRRAADTIVLIENALKRMYDRAWRSRFIALEPANRWGDFAVALEVMETLLKAAVECPEHTWHIQ